MTLDRLTAVLTGAEDSAVLPLFWQKGDDLDAVTTELERIADAGIRQVILEARPHPDFLGEGWWRDVDALLEIARRRGLRVWFFDDDTFPTGHAAGAVRSAPENLRRRFLDEWHTDVTGPAPGAWLQTERHPFFGPAAARRPGVLQRVVAYRRAEDSHELIGEPIDLTDRVRDGAVWWDVPAGHWRVFMITLGADGGSERHAEHIDYLNPDSVQLLIDTVYEATYARYAEEFGGTIAGFFSDEPGLYNNPDTFDFDSRLGKRMPLSWNEHVATALAERLGGDPLLLAPLLWHPAGGDERAVRFGYLDAVSSLYAEHFSRRIGDWCRAHDVAYIGHVIEDNGAHSRLGPGAGHYFRAMAGQDLPGVDIIGGQVVPGASRGPSANMPGHADGEFFHFTLAKLASSAAHLDAATGGRSMCETIGASGWYAGLRLQRWLTHHLLVRGVTHIVPHAFSPAPFPDLDCPPHFYARGMNPQYPHHHLLTALTDRLSHLLQGGVHRAPVAVLYHAEAEWLGEAMAVDRPLRLLAEHQLDADIVPADGLPADGSLRMGTETYEALVVPGSAYLPRPVAEALLRLDDAGVPVVFVDAVPAVEGGRADALRARFAAVGQRELADVIDDLAADTVRVAGHHPDLRVLRVDHGEADAVFVVNESVAEAVWTTLTVPRGGAAVRVDVEAPGLVAAQHTARAGSVELALDLAPGEAALYLVGNADAWAGHPVAPRRAQVGAPSAPDLHWRMALRPAGEPSFGAERPIDALGPLAGHDARFAGTVRYRTTLPAASGEFDLDLGGVGEIAEARLDGQSLGVRLSAPYRFALPEGALAGGAELEVEVTTTLAPAQRDFFSAFALQEPAGLLGPVRLIGIEEAS